jgi:hypothetical protein
MSDAVGYSFKPLTQDLLMFMEIQRGTSLQSNSHINEPNDDRMPTLTTASDGLVR